MGATLQIKLSVLSNKIKCKTSVNLQLTCHPAIFPPAYQTRLINFMLINKHHEMETFLYVTTIIGHFLPARVLGNYTTEGPGTHCIGG